MLLQEKISDPNPKIVAATVHPSVNATKDPKLRSIPGIIFVGLPQRRDYGLRCEPILERHDASFHCPGESLPGGAELFGGGDDHAVTLLRSGSEQGYALDEVALGPETEDLQLDHLPGVRVSQCKVRDERRFSLWEWQHIASPFEIPAARVLRAPPGPDESPADIIGLALVLWPQVMTLQSGRL